jgi:protoporphyrinogen oxidase
MLEFLGKDGWLHHERESWIWMRDRFIPYPFQNNIHRLPAADLDRCLQGLLEIARSPRPKPETFRDWIEASFGPGIGEVFLFPYNFKVWGYPPELLSADWVGERVATTDFSRVLRNLAFSSDDPGWGPNNTFRFPKRGGTGSIWRACASLLPGANLIFGCGAERIDLDRHAVHCSDGRIFVYDELISTVPLTELIRISRSTKLQRAAERGLLFSTSNVVGMGLAGQPRAELAKKCWMYFPEGNCPFYRVTVFSNYSPNNVPDPRRHWSLMAEVSETRSKRVNGETLIEEVIKGALTTGLIESRENIVSLWSHRAAHGYPTPSVNRDHALEEIIPYFESQHVFPRGRFGLWKYEVSNQDHCFMQGVEIVERLLHERQEITGFDPNHANSRKHPWPFERWQAPADVRSVLA